MENAVNFFSDKKNKKVFFFLTIILCFALGALISALISKAITTYSICVVSAIYIAILIILLINKAEPKEVE